MARKHAVVVGTLRVISRAIDERLSTDPDWDVVALSRCAPDFETTARHVARRMDKQFNGAGARQTGLFVGGFKSGRLPPFRRVKSNRRVEGHEFPVPAALGTINRHRVSTSGPRRESMTLSKDARGLGMPWEDLYGYAQAIRVGDTIYVSGQLSHDDEGNIVGPAPLNEKGEILDHSNMETQMRQTYANAGKILGRYGATLQNVVEEVLYVTDMGAAFSAAGPVRKKAYGSERPAVASTIVTTSRLALPTQLIEIKFTARV